MVDHIIESLTEDQINLCGHYKNKWLEIGLSTSGINVTESLKHLKQAYENVGLSFPEQYEVYDSPSAAITAMKEKHNIDVKSDDFVYGCHDAFWLARNDYFLNVLDIEECDKLSPFMELSKHCGWALLYDELVVLTKKPVHIKMDAEKISHCENDYAIKYADNTGIAIWHGVNIPEEWIFDKSTITPDVLFKWKNIEQRRAACEILGWQNVISKLDATVIDKDEETTVGTLLEVNLPDSGKERFLVAYDLNVGKEVGLPVPRDMETALDANAWTYGIDIKQISADVFRNAAKNRA